MPLQVIDYGLIQTDFMNPKIGKIFSTRLLCFCSRFKRKSFPLLFFFVAKKIIFRSMASLRADDDPQASEYAGKDPPDDSDNDEGLYVETNANR